MYMTIYRVEIIGRVVCVVRAEEFADRDNHQELADQYSGRR